MSIRQAAIATLLVLAATTLLASAAVAGKKATPRSYSVPLTCGHQDSTTGSAVAGDYASAVTVTNLHREEAKVRVSFTLTEPASDDCDHTSRTLDSAESIQIDCDMVRDGAFIQPVPLESNPFFRGVLTVVSATPLSVVAETTAAGLDGGISISSRQIPGTPMDRKLKPEEEAPEGATEICHIPPGNPGNRHTITVESSAVGAHLAHGDHRDRCEAR